jgi:hypothetical protein
MRKHRLRLRDRSRQRFWFRQRSWFWLRQGLRLRQHDRRWVIFGLNGGFCFSGRKRNVAAATVAASFAAFTAVIVTGVFGASHADIV